jgi:hypothetical protein
MIDSLTKRPNISNNHGQFISELENNSKLFANLICVTFSAFDDFDHPPEQRDKSSSIRYSYIGLKDAEENGKLVEPKSPTLLKDELIKSIIFCRNNSRISSWKTAIATLETDPIFKDANIASLIEIESKDELHSASTELFRRLSSGHNIVLLTITRLVETMEERSLVLIDEPESHLHPPLLSSFTRALSDLLKNRNAVSIIATHSPVVLQEVPKSCVWKLRRIGAEAIGERLQIECFGENVGVLTQEVFGLEVTNSGFHKILRDLVKKYNTYDDAVLSTEDQMGLEAKAILRSLFYQKEKLNAKNS